MHPFSDNIIFYDAEFSSLNPYEGELLSVGMIKPGGEELYIEIEHEGVIHPWTLEHVVPFLTGEKISRTEAVEKIREFIGDKNPYLVAYVNAFDTIFLYKLFGIQNNTRDEVPQHWIPIDFASMIFAHDINPESFRLDDHKMMKKLGIDRNQYRKHHALDDARLLKDMYEKMVV